MGALEKHMHVSLPSWEQNRGKLGKAFGAFLSEDKLRDKLRQGQAIVINCIKGVAAGKDLWSSFRSELVNDGSTLGVEFVDKLEACVSK
jgi:hypothetical protein